MQEMLLNINKKMCRTFGNLQNMLILLLFLLSTLPLYQTSSFDYKDALHKSFLYFEAQRSGHLPYNQRVRWRDHSGLTDGLEQGVDLVGGYYDAGDNVKFGLPLAFTITMLSWGVMEYRDQIADAGEYAHALEAIKWGTDYFIKAHPHPHVFWAQVGDGETDHFCWQRPEDMTTSRFAFKIDENSPGSDVVAETAAAMAAASIVFRRTNSHYSHLLLEHAQQLFEFGDKYRGTYEGAKGYYTSVSGYTDELLWAALWLYKATHNAQYLNYAIENAESLGGIAWEVTEFSWDVKYGGLQILAAMLPMEGKTKHEKQILQQYRTKAESFICACLNHTNSTNVRRTPGGLLWIRKWNNLQYVVGASFLLTVYSDYLHSTNQVLSCPKHSSLQSHEIFSFVKSQVDYILGSNPMRLSYFVGYGSAYPQKVHHRGASAEPYKYTKVFVGCKQSYEKWYGNPNPNPNVLVGAVVGGPDDKDEFRDRRDNFAQTEACTYTTAMLVGIFAKLDSLGNSRRSTWNASGSGILPLFFSI